MPEGSKERYFVREGDEEPREVDVQEWMRLEEYAGFGSKTPGRPSTGCFIDSLSRIRGTMAFTEEQVAEAIALLKRERSE